MNCSNAKIGAFRKGQMYYIFVGIGAFLIGYVTSTIVESDRRKKAGLKSRDNSKQYEENLEKLRNFAKSKKEFTNADVEKEIGVSDATATRYCDELEKEGLVTQVGTDGPKVKYMVK